MDAYDSEQFLSVNRMHQRHMNRDTNDTRTFLPREIWNQLPEESKNIIRGKSPNQTTMVRKINAHDMVAIDYDFSTPGALLTANNTELSSDLADNDPEAHAPSDNSAAVNTEDSAAILAHITNRQTLPADHDVRSVLASAHNRRKGGINAPVNMRNPPFGSPLALETKKDTVVVDGKCYVQVDNHRVQYRVDCNSTSPSAKMSSLVDRGANGGLAGQDVRLIETTMRLADVSGSTISPSRDFPSEPSLV